MEFMISSLCLHRIHFPSISPRWRSSGYKYLFLSFLRKTYLCIWKWEMCIAVSFAHSATLDQTSGVISAHLTLAGCRNKHIRGFSSRHFAIMSWPTYSNSLFLNIRKLSSEQWNNFFKVTQVSRRTGLWTLFSLVPEFCVYFLSSAVQKGEDTWTYWIRDLPKNA